MSQITKLFSGLLRITRPEKKEIISIYSYAIFSGLIQLSLPLGVQAIISYVLGGSMVTSVFLLITLVVTGVLFTGLMQIGQMKIIEKLQQRIFVRYSFQFAERLPAFDLEKADKQYLPELTNRFFDIITLQKALSKILLDVPAATIQIVFGLILLSVYHPTFIIFGVILLGILWLILWLTAARGLQTSLKESSNKYEVAGWLEEMARVIRSFKYSQGTHFNLRATDIRVGNYLVARTSHFKVLLVQFGALLGFKVVVTALMLFVGALLLVKQQLNIGQFIAAEIVILTVITSVEKLIKRLDSVYDALTSVEKLDQVVEGPLEQGGDFPLEGTGPLKLSMEHVTFAYANGQPVVHNCSFVVNPGEKAVLSGANGSGKSTVLRLFTGSYSGFTGSILVNDMPIGNYQLQSLRSCTGIMAAQMDIFKGTLWENITLGRNGISTEEVLELAREIGLHDFIASRKEGLETLLEPAGSHIPAGVSRKILLLRALVNHPRLLLLEEPWQGFDPEEKQRIQQLLLTRFNQTTVLVVTNDADFIRQCNRNILLNSKN